MISRPGGSGSDDPVGAAPVSAEEFADYLNTLLYPEAPERIAIACSGGPDSMALAWLTARWARSRDAQPLALIVDHALRPESAEEAALTARRLTVHSIPARILTRQGDAISRNVQAEARKARYALLAEACAEAGIHHLLLAHHQEDQAETLLLRLARGSGVEGLSAMAPRLDPPAGPALLRPLLDIPKDRLAATLRMAGLDAVQDPSNRNPSHARVRMRMLMPLLQAEGLTPTRLAATARQMARAAQALDDAARDLADRAVDFLPAGYAHIALAPLNAAPEAIRLRLLSRLVQTISGTEHPPRLERLENLCADIHCHGGRLPAPRTLGGCRIAMTRDGKLLISREAVAAERCRMQAREHMVWDGRFRITLDTGTPEAGLFVAALGRDGMRRLRQAGRADDPAQDPPGAVRSTLPTLYDAQGDILHVPHLNWAAGGSHAQIRMISPVPPHGFRFASFSSAP